MLWNRLTYATTLLGVLALGCSSGASDLREDDEPDGHLGSEQRADAPNANGSGSAQGNGGASTSAGAISTSDTGGVSSGGTTGSVGSGQGTGGGGTGGDQTVLEGHLSPHCEPPDTGEVFCIENGNGYPGDTITLSYYFYYSAPHDGLASGTAAVSLPEGFRLSNPVPVGVDLCGYLTSVGTAVSIQFNPIDYHWQQGSDCPMTGTQFEVHQMGVIIDESVSPGDYEIAIAAVTMSGAQGGVPEIPAGPSSKLPGMIRVLED